MCKIQTFSCGGGGFAYTQGLSIRPIRQLKCLIKLLKSGGGQHISDNVRKRSLKGFLWRFPEGLSPLDRFFREHIFMTILGF